jgi:branched-chain amino acid transport system permease protein
MQYWLNVILQGVLLGGLYALFAAGLSLIFGVMRLVNIAHGDLIVVCAYLAYSATILLGIGPFAALFVILPIVALLGYALQRGLLNFTLGEELPPLMVTIGLSVVIQNVLLMAYTPDTHRLHAGPIEVASLQLTSEISVGVLPLLQFVVAVATVGVLQFVFYRTRLGRSFRATADDPEVAELMGVETDHVFGLAMALSLVVVAIAAVFIAARVNFDPFSGPLLLIFGFEAIIIGGLGNIWGTLAGGVILGVAQTLGGQINVGFPFLAGHLVFLALLIVRPQGLFPKAA